MRALLCLAFAAGLVGAAGAQSLEPTRETGIGVWYQPGAPAVEAMWQAGDPGERLLLSGRVRGTDGESIAGAQVELWQADGAGRAPGGRYRTTLRTREAGRFAVSTVLPGYIWRARHIHVVVSHPGYEELVTRILFKGDPLLVEMPYPELAINLERGRHEGEEVWFGVVELVLRARAG